MVDSLERGRNTNKANESGFQAENSNLESYGNVANQISLKHHIKVSKIILMEIQETRNDRNNLKSLSPSDEKSTSEKIKARKKNKGKFNSITSRENAPLTLRGKILGYDRTLENDKNKDLEPAYSGRLESKKAHNNIEITPKKERKTLTTKKRLNHLNK